MRSFFSFIAVLLFAVCNIVLTDGKEVKKLRHQKQQIEKNELDNISHKTTTNSIIGNNNNNNNNKNSGRQRQRTNNRVIDKNKNPNVIGHGDNDGDYNEWSCENRCFAQTHVEGGCFCDTDCGFFYDCCDDYQEYCYHDRTATVQEKKADNKGVQKEVINERSSKFDFKSFTEEDVQKENTNELELEIEERQRQISTPAPTEGLPIFIWSPAPTPGVTIPFIPNEFTTKMTEIALGIDDGVMTVDTDDIDLDSEYIAIGADVEQEQSVYTGLRFRNVYVPTNAKEVTEAFITLHMVENESCYLKVNINGERSNESPDFERLNGDFSPTTRKCTLNVVKWQIPVVDITNSSTIDTPNLNEIMNEQILKDTWSNGSPMTFFFKKIEGSNTCSRMTYGFGSNGTSATLTYTYRK